MSIITCITEFVFFEKKREARGLFCSSKGASLASHCIDLKMDNQGNTNNKRKNNFLKKVRTPKNVEKGK
jgi:hypothetical protein